MAEARRRTSGGHSVDEEATIAMQSNNGHVRPRTPEERGLMNEKGDHVHHPGHRQHHIYPTRPGFERFRDRFFRKDKPKVGVAESLKNIVFSSWINLFLVFLPIAWVAHFGNYAHEEETWPYPLTFTLCFLAIIPLEKLFDYGGEQMGFYVGKDFGDLIIITLNNAVEATLAIILLTKCHLKLLQSTIIGVVVLHLLLIPGTSFIVGGARVMHQDLQAHNNELNHTLLTVGVLTLLLPAAFFAALSRGDVTSPEAADTIINAETRTTFLNMSRGLAILLLTVYICSRIYLHNPPGDNNAMTVQPNAPKAAHKEEEYLEEKDPELNQWVAIVMLIITIALMAATAEWLVDSIEFVREQGRIEEEWFGLVLLPIVSFSADGAVAIGYFIRSSINHLLGRPKPPATLAQARGIDLSIQFTLFWMPFLVLLGWWTNKPMSLLFDLFEVALVIASCLLVNYVTADARTNWAEGYAMVTFYVMIALVAWWYPGQIELEELFQSVCNLGEVASAAAEEAAGNLIE